MKTERNTYKERGETNEKEESGNEINYHDPIVTQGRGRGYSDTNYDQKEYPV